MRTEAYGDYCERLKEPFSLIRVARDARDPRLAVAASKGAIVLAAAALERYLNDAILNVCRLLAVEEWEDLGPGFRSYMAQQIARRLDRAVAPVLEAKTVGDKEQAKLKKAIDVCREGFERPAAWDHHPQFGLLTSGDAAPEKIGATLVRFSSEGRDFLEELDKTTAGKDVFMRSLAELVDARHAAAHALRDRSDPGPTDAQAWVVTSFWLARRIDSFLEAETLANDSQASTAG